MATYDSSDLWDDEADQANQAFVESQPQYSQPPRNQWQDSRGFRGGGGRGGGRGGARNRGEPLEFGIESNETGQIIGRGGSKIKELESKSGASIQIDYSGYSPLVKIYGNPEAKSEAKRLIDEILHPPPRTMNSNFSDKKDDEPFDWGKVRDNLNKIEEERLARFKSQSPIIKDFYVEDPAVARMSPQEVEKIRLENNNILIAPLKEGDNRGVPNPVTSFEQAFRPYPEILSELLRVGFKKPTPIQCQAWPILLKGYDMVGVAQTGTGKTISFLLPALIHIENQPTPKHKRKGPSCLVLAPTRELALQIFEETQKYKYKNIRSIYVYGGKSRREQSQEIKQGAEIIIATPGRLMDFINDGTLDLITVTYLVIDEADRMLDMGFEKDLRLILHYVRPDRQTVMTSATWPVKVQEIAEKYMSDPMRVNVSSVDLVASDNVEQHFIFSDEYDEKKQILFEFIEQMQEDDKVLVFVERKAMVDDIASDIVLKFKMDCSAIQSDYDQHSREQALDDFKSGFSRILIATDVASRGLDVKDVTHVFNLNMPREIEEYVHRIGRTGRAGRKGISVTIISYYDSRKVIQLIKILEESKQGVPEELYRMADKYKRRQENRNSDRFGDRPRNDRFGDRPRNDRFDDRPRRGRGRDHY